MTIKIELSDAALVYAGRKLSVHAGYSGDWWDRLPPSTGLDDKYKKIVRVAFNAALEAMVEEGTAVEGYADNLGLVRVLTIRLGGKP